MNGHGPVTGDGAIVEQVRRLRDELEATQAEVARLSELQQTMELERQAALRDAVVRTRETIQEMEREHGEALRRIEEETEAEIQRIRSMRDGGQETIR